MSTDLKKLVEELITGGDEIPPADALPEGGLPIPEVIESDSEEAWNDFQDSQIAYDKSFLDSQLDPP